MAGPSAIEWTDRTWNPVRGCTRVSPGCGGPGPHGGCYAERIAARFSGPGLAYEGLAEMRGGIARWTGQLSFGHDLDAPLRWREPCRVFVNSMSDLFHEAVPDAEIDRVFAVMALAPRHTFQVLTKRSARMRAYMTDPEVAARVGRIQREFDPGTTCYENVGQDGIWPLPTVWLGVSAEDQRRADERVPDLVMTPAAVRFVSAEPLLGRIDLTALDTFDGGRLDVLRGVWAVAPVLDTPRGAVVLTRRPPRLDGLIVGGESGPRARPMHPDWVRDLRDACAGAGIAFFFKQWGAWKPISEMTEGEGDALYRSRRIAGPGQDQGDLDEMYGHRCTVPVARLGYGGATGFDAFEMVDGRGGMTLFRVGKGRAGRTLDSAVHDALPGRSTREAALA